jgi:hypothetical protein
MVAGNVMTDNRVNEGIREKIQITNSLPVKIITDI